MLQPDPVLDERFEEIISELRDARIATPAPLMERVETLAARLAPPPPRRRALRPHLARRLHLTRGRAVIGLGTLAGAGLVVAALATLGGGPSSRSGRDASAPPAGTSAPYAAGASTVAAAGDPTSPSTSPAWNVASEPATTPAPDGITREAVSGTKGAAGATPKPPLAYEAVTTASAPVDVTQPGRLQHESAALEVALPTVAAVSDATGAVTRSVQGYGGYVVAVSFDAARSGTGSIVAKVPIDKMQAAIARFAALGTVTAEHVDLTDLQRQADSQEQRLAVVNLRIARLKGQIAAPGIATGDLYVARAKLAQARLDLANLKHAAQATATQAAMADLSVTLRSRAVTKQVAPAHRNGIARSAGNALGILGSAGKVAVYVLILAAPLLVIGLIGFVIRGRWRSRRERLLLEGA